MTIISLIAAVDETWGIGKDNGLLCHLPADLKKFKQLTLGKPIIMGRKTFESIGKALPGRFNIVLSKHPVSIDGVTVVNSVSQALDLAVDSLEIMIIGGGKIFEQALPLANRVYLTVIHHQFDADVFFPKLDVDEWNMQEKGKWTRDDKNEYDMAFYQFDRK